MRSLNVILPSGQETIAKVSRWSKISRLKELAIASYVSSNADEKVTPTAAAAKRDALDDDDALDAGEERIKRLRSELLDAELAK
jgi:hypothetical protein